MIESNRALEAGEEQEAIVQRLRGGRHIAVAGTAQRNRFNPAHLESLVLVDQRVWRAASDAELQHFWAHGDLIVTRDVVTGYGDGYKEYYFDIKFDPRSFTRNPPRLPAQPLPELPEEPSTHHPAQPTINVPDDRRRGGRPSGKAGEPIATITMRLMRLAPEELAKQTAASLALDLIEEYKRLGLVPPVSSNAEREAAGILRALRK